MLAQTIAIVVCLTTLLVSALPTLAQHKHGEGKHGEGKHHGTRFDDPEKWAKSFDSPERAAWQKPDEVVKSLALKPDARVADIGAGTGYFAMRLARAVPQGIVFAVDLEPRMVAWLGQRAKSLGLDNVRAVQGAAASPNLPEPVDLALFVNVYHHIDARPAYFARLAASLRPGSRIAIIDQNEKAEGGPPRHMRVTVAQIDAEMQQAGFTRIAQHDFLPRQNFVMYEVAKK
jgi:cyclopropane fatty-acyl-phospholipid synthase-like methyltransferase